MVTKIKIEKIIFKIFLIIIFLLPTIAYGYVDPGVLGILFQVIFAFTFGSVLICLIKPYKYIIKVIQKIKSRFDSKKNVIFH